MKIKYTITGLDCPNCAAKLASMIEKNEGITSAKINFLSEKLTVESELSEENTLELVKKISKSFSSDIEVIVK